MTSFPEIDVDYLGLVGTRVGPYLVTERASSGGFAMVYRAEHETMHYMVAIKVLTPEAVPAKARPLLLQHFLREAQILGQLRSEDILRAHDHGEVLCPADGKERPYLIVDWLDGDELSKEFARRLEVLRPYSLLEAIELLEPIARALSSVHEAGLVHRDVNPRNIFLELKDPRQPPRAKLIDFGFAKEAAEEVHKIRLERSGGTLFARSPDYAAPEHYDRERYGELSAKTDIYTFALILVQALTLEEPLSGRNAEELQNATLDPSQRPTPRRYGAQVSDEVEQLFAEALAVRQEDRPGNILDWWARLKAAAQASAAAAPAVAPAPTAGVIVAPPPGSDAGVEAPPMSSAIPPRPTSRRRRIVALAIAIPTLLGAFALLGFTVWEKWFAPLECEAGFADCNGVRSDGCETALDTNVAHCGSCQAACSDEHGTPACSAGKCRVAECRDKSRADCNEDAKDGCEVDTTSDPAHCGGCGSACGTACTTKVSCDEGSCNLTCKRHCGDCDEQAKNGCEVDLRAQPDDCGRCGFSCGDRSCNDGLCATEEVARLGSAEHVTVLDGSVYYWEPKAGEIRMRPAKGEEKVLVSGVKELTGLAVGSDVLVYAKGKLASVYALPLGQNATPKALAGPMPSDTPLSVSADRAHVSWAFRTKPALAGFPNAQKKVVTAPLSERILEEEPRVAECKDWPGEFAGDERQQFCCQAGKPLTAYDCRSEPCKERRYSVGCPGTLTLDDDRVYWSQGVRVLAIERDSGKLLQLARRARNVSNVAVDASHVYWLEGSHTAKQIWRVVKSADGKVGVTAPERIADRRETPTFLLPTKSLLYWAETGTGEGGVGLSVLNAPLPAP